MPRLREFRWDSWADWAERHATGADLIAVDTETSGLGFYDEPFCATLTWRGPEGLQSAYVSLEGEGRDERIAVLRRILASAPTWLFHNAKFDLQKLDLVGALPPGWEHEHELHDTQLVAYVLNENERKALKHLARVVLGEATNEDEVLKRVRRKLGLRKEDGYQHIPRQYLIPYALKDTEFTLRLYEALWPKLERRDPALVQVYAAEVELTRVLLRMEATGFGLDLGYLDATATEYGERVMEGLLRVIELAGDPQLNPQSPRQLLAAFAERGVFLDSTDEATLRQVEDELAGAILDYRRDKKLYTTYLRALQDEHRDGVVHPWFNPVGARTGRMSSGGASN